MSNIKELKRLINQRPEILIFEESLKNYSPEDARKILRQAKQNRFFHSQTEFNHLYNKFCRDHFQTTPKETSELDRNNAPVGYQFEDEESFIQL